MASVMRGADMYAHELQGQKQRRLRCDLYDGAGGTPAGLTPGLAAWAASAARSARQELPCQPRE